jgi:3-phosphoinositide dependent protein kinase-1
MLNDNRSGPATDLWALGCIIYQMRVGNVPFNGQHEQEVFQKITDRQLQFPNDLEPEAIDLIDQLLHLDPQQRLGSGPKGSLNSMEMLKQHPYFQGLSFKNLAK